MSTLIPVFVLAGMATAEVGPAVTANSDFAVDLYRQLAKEQKGKNLFFSPYSLSSALAMTAEGARGETANQMGRVLRFPETARRSGDDAQSIPWNMAPIHSGLAALDERYNPKPVSAELRDKIAALRKDLEATNRKADELRSAGKWREEMEQAQKSQKLAAALNSLLGQVDLYELRVANALWGEKTYPFEQSYWDTVHRFYRTGGVFPVDFKDQSEAARRQINAWVEEQTNKRIRDLIAPGGVNAGTRLVLTNAIYFKGEWKEPFAEHATKEEDFAALDGRKVPVPMMHKDHLAAARYAAFNADGTFFPTPAAVPAEGQPDPRTLYPGKGGFVLAELPYKGDDLSMVVILPQDDLAELENRLGSDSLRAWIGQLQHRPVHVYLPKFKLETDYQLKDTLRAMGLSRAFVDPTRPDGAQFDGMCASRDPEHKLSIGNVVHKAFVDVNEKGTEAAAATAVIMPMAAAFHRPTTVPFTPTFRADRPFLFVIRDVKAGTVLFLGRMTSPKGHS